MYVSLPSSPHPKPRNSQFPSSDLPKIVLNHLDLSLLLSASGKQGYFLLGSSIHSSFIKNPEIFNPNEDSKDSNNALVVWNSLLGMYSRCGTLTDLTNLFDEMPMRDTVSWNTLGGGFSMICLKGMLFTWTAMISGLVQNELYEESLELFNQMRSGSVCPNSLTYLSSLTACSGLQALMEGRQIHGLLWKLGIQSELCIESSLMDMYSKCGNVNDVLGIFESAQNLDEISMTVILVGLAQNGFEEEAKRFFVKMFIRNRY
ncbi:hypothetical protein V6N13_067233 [Hibiscus sabdariffa]